LEYFDTVKLFDRGEKKQGKWEGAWWKRDATRRAITKRKAMKAEDVTQAQLADDDSQSSPTAPRRDTHAPAPPSEITALARAHDSTLYSQRSGQDTNEPAIQTEAAPLDDTTTNSRKRRYEVNDDTAEAATKVSRRADQLDAPTSSRSRVNSTSNGGNRQILHVVQQGSATVAPPPTITHSTMPDLQILHPAWVLRLPDVEITSKIVGWQDHARQDGLTQILNHLETVTNLAGADQRLALLLVAKTPRELERERTKHIVQRSGWTYEDVFERLWRTRDRDDMVRAQAALNVSMGDTISAVYGYLFVPQVVRTEIAHLHSMANSNGSVPGVHEGMTSAQRSSIINAAIYPSLPTQDALLSVFRAVGMDWWQFFSFVDGVPDYIWRQMEYCVRHMARRDRRP